MPITIQESLGAIEKSVREGNDEFRKQFKDADTLLKSQGETLKALEGRVAGAEEALKARKLHSLPGSEDARFNYGLAFRGIWTGDWSGAESERELLKRAQSQGDDAKGGYLVPIQHMAMPIEALAAEAVVLRAGATPMLGLSGGNVEIPRLSGTATLAAQASEGTALTTTDYTFGQVVLAEKTVGGLVLVSKKNLRNSAIALDAFIKTQLFKDAARKADYLALLGSGSSGEPLGVVQDTDINDVEIGTNGGNFTNEVAIDMAGTLEDADAMPVDESRVKLIWHPAVKRVLMKQRIKNFADQDLEAMPGWGYVVPGVSNKTLADYLGYDHLGTTQLRKNLTKGSGTNLGEAVLGDWSQLIWAVWGNVEFAVSEHHKFAEDQIALKIVLNLSFGVRHPEAFCLVNDATTVMVSA